MKYFATTFSTLCISFATATPALSYHNCDIEPPKKEVVCEVVEWIDMQRNWSRNQETITGPESQVICVADGFSMKFTIHAGADRELKEQIFVKEPITLEVCIRKHP